MPLFLIYLYFIDWDIQFITLVTIVEAHSNIFTAAAQKRDLNWGAEPGIEPGLAVQQADALLFELRRGTSGTVLYFTCAEIEHNGPYAVIKEALYFDCALYYSLYSSFAREDI
jgi:hypothetical protein